MEYSNSRLREVVGEYVHNQRDRELLCRRFIDGVVLEKLAEEFEISVSQVTRIIMKYNDTIFWHMPKED
jgi:DNA-directed RNA polymerase specialized sigma subunit